MYKRQTPHELRTIIRDESVQDDGRAVTLLFESFGFKYGNPTDVDFMFDVRCLPNPHWQPELRPLTGLDQPVADFLAAQELTGAMLQQIRDFVDYWLPHFIADNRNYITVGIGCTGGQHRSVYLVNQLWQHFSQNKNLHTLARHRELRHTAHA